MRIFLEPNETLLFRTGRPFEAGEVDYAETLFPPTPETMQGVIRALIATYWNTKQSLAKAFNDTDLTDLIGDRNGYGRFRITNIALARRNIETKVVEPLYPTPAHLLEKGNSKFYIAPDKDNKYAGIVSNMPTGMGYLAPLKKETGDKKKSVGKITPVEGWLVEQDLQRTLRLDETALASLKIISRNDIFLYEPRVGIGMENFSKSTRDGLFYSAQMLRMRPDHGFIVDIGITDKADSTTLLPYEQVQEALKLKKDRQGWATMGGEQRAVSFEVIGDAPLLPNSKVQMGRGSLLYLATPAALDQGWRPANWPQDLTPVSAAITRYERIGGWRLQPEHNGGSNKCMRRCVPAGSVYFFNSSIELPRTRADQKSLTDYGKEIGYGITIIGEWQK